MALLDIHKRPLPTFREWLEQHSPGTQASSYEAFSDLTARTQEQSLEHLKPNEAAFARIWMGACIAAVELCNMEEMKHSTPPDIVLGSLARAFGCASMYAIASACKPGTPFRDIAKMLTEDFRAATKLAADELTAQGG